MTPGERAYEAYRATLAAADLPHHWHWQQIPPMHKRAWESAAAAVVADVQRELADWQAGAKAEADAGDEARNELAALRDVVERIESLFPATGEIPVTLHKHSKGYTVIVRDSWTRWHPRPFFSETLAQALAAAEAARKEGETC